MAVHPGAGGRQEEVFRVSIIARRLGGLHGRASTGAASRGLAQEFPFHCRGDGEAPGCHTASQDLERFFVLFADQAWKACLSVVGICRDKWLLLIVEFFSQSSFSNATGIYLVKKQLISLFDLDVEMNHIKFQVK